MKYSNKKELAYRSRRIAAFFTLGIFLFFAFFAVATSYGLWWWKQEHQASDFQYKSSTISRILSRNLSVASLDADTRQDITHKLTLVIKNEHERHVIKVIVDRFRVGFLESEIERLNFGDSVLRFRFDDAEYFAFKFPFIRNERYYTAYMVERVETPSDLVYQDIFITMPFVVAISIGFYFIILALVRSTFRPVEWVLDDLETFVHNAGHELKTPLSVVDSGLQYLLAIESFDRRTVESARAEVVRMTGLIDGLIELASIQPTVQSDRVSIVDELETVIAECEPTIRAKHLTVRRQYVQHPIVNAPKKYLTILLGNIVRNAVKYNRDGGTVTIRVDDTSVTIADTGIGIPSDELERVFDRFFRAGTVRKTRVEWTGLGLALAKKIVDVVGWRLVIASEENVGTTVMIEFTPAKPV